MGAARESGTQGKDLGTGRGARAGRLVAHRVQRSRGPERAGLTQGPKRHARDKLRRRQLSKDGAISQAALAGALGGFSKMR